MAEAESGAPGDIDVGSVLRATFADLEKQKKGALRGINYGFSELDEMTLGLRRGDLVVIAGRPSMGVSTFALNVLRNTCVGRPGLKARPEHGSVFFSLEMSGKQVAERLLCSMARINVHHLQAGFTRREDEESLIHCSEILSYQRVFIDDSPRLTATDIANKARRLKSEGKIDCVFVDNLQLMSREDLCEQKLRWEIVGDITRSLKLLARELEIPVVALSHLNRNVEDRPDHRPRMADLAESGNTEQDADVVMLVHRDEYYVTKERAEAELKQNRAQIIVVKNRNGPTGEAELFFDKEWGYFGELDR
jgi:replicative DNA helicase